MSLVCGFFLGEWFCCPLSTQNKYLEIEIYYLAMLMDYFGLKY